MSSVNFKRSGFHSITPYLMVDDVLSLIRFIEAVFDGTTLSLKNRKDGSVMHAEMKLGDSMIMLGEPMEGYDLTPGSLYIYVEDCDSVYKKALSLDVEVILEPTTMYHAGERYAGIKDASGNLWWIATHVEDITAEEEERRIKELGL